MCKQGLFYVCKEMLVGKLHFPRVESQLPNSDAVTRYVFNKPNPEDKLNVDFEKDNLNLAAYGTKKRLLVGSRLCFLRCQEFLHF